MTEEQKALFKKESKRIALEIMALAMEFPGVDQVIITATDRGYFDATVFDDEKIYSYSKTAGHAPSWWEIEK